MIKNQNEINVLSYCQQFLKETKYLQQKLQQEGLYSFDNEEDLKELEFVCENRERLLNILKSQYNNMLDASINFSEIAAFVEQVMDLDKKILHSLTNLSKQTAQEIGIVYQNKTKIQGYNLKTTNRR